MIDLDYSFFIQLANFLVTIFVLNTFLIRPIRSQIKERADFMAGRMGEIEKFGEQAEGKLAAYEKALDEARKGAMEVRTLCKSEAGAEETKLMEAANQQAAATLKAAREAIAVQAKEAMGKLSAEVNAFAKLAATKILGQN